MSSNTTGPWQLASAGGVMSSMTRVIASFPATGLTTNFSAAYSAVHPAPPSRPPAQSFSAAYSAVHANPSSLSTDRTFSAAYSAVHRQQWHYRRNHIFSAAYSAVHTYSGAVVTLNAAGPAPVSWVGGTVS